MSVASPQDNFIVSSTVALKDPNLRSALGKAQKGFVEKRADAIAAAGDFEAMRDMAQAVRQKALADLDVYLQQFEANVEAAGGHVYWAETADDMRRIVLDICVKSAAQYVTKGKSMVSEEVGLNAALEEAGLTVFETDLGEYIIQLAEEPPSHIVAPALHKTRQQIIDLFKNHHDLGDRNLGEIQAIVDEARMVIRERYLKADVGITGANMLIAESGTTVIVTNEGNGDLTASLPKTHIVTASIEKIVPTWDDASKIMRVLARSATGQAITAYTTFFTGAKGADDFDGPENFHVVLLDNGRSEMLGGEFREMLQCIRCAACINHCPVYQSVGGHAYNSTYPGPMGAILTPLLRGEDRDYMLPNASSLCGRCDSVCPVRIPLSGLLRKLRDKRPSNGKLGGRAVSFFSWLACRPKLYAFVTNLGAQSLRLAALGKGKLRRMPLMSNWTRFKDLPIPDGGSFQQQWKKRR
ncbi:MAG: LutB/LldF family L-lactate oxidation iron-sulfur protein [Pseudomonadales bacterium]